ncbi:hypothetical protein [Candidatus Nitrotoga arctica]|uniref:hypothetical protein n=1 Tax=Candidatus Nitrotoga arctica TaxID=453162 RepID=UPI001EFB0681|nr:hypothetical protein [Candidatus Nitrotoga arctica]
MASDAPNPLPLWPDAVIEDKSQTHTHFENNAVHRACKMYVISAQVELKLQNLVKDMRMVKDQVWSKSKTAGQRKNELKLVKEKAAELKLLVMGLTFEDRFNLDDEYFGQPGDPRFDLALDLIEDPAILNLAGKLIPDIENAAMNVRARIKHVVKPERHADFIRCIAQALKSTNIKPGVFQEVSIAVFADAGVMMSERALRVK